jgi:hypothetical protein
MEVWRGIYNFRDRGGSFKVDALFMGFLQEESLQVSILQRLILHLAHKQQMHTKTRVLKPPPNQSPSRKSPPHTATSAAEEIGNGGGVRKGSYQWHRFPDFLAGGTVDSLIAPTMFGLVGFCYSGEFMDVLPPPMFVHVFVVSRHESLGETDVLVVCRRDTSVEGLHNQSPTQSARGRG